MESDAAVTLVGTAKSLNVGSRPGIEMTLFLCNKHEEIILIKCINLVGCRKYNITSKDSL